MRTDIKKMEKTMTDSTQLSTPELSKKLGIKPRTMTQRLLKFGHVYGHKPCGYVKGGNTYLWEKKEEI